MTKRDIIERAKKAGACRSGVEWAEAQPDAETILKDCPHEWRMWAVFQGLLEFAEHCDWAMVSGYDWSILLHRQPQLAEHCDWTKLDGDDWSCLLCYQPQLAEKMKEVTK